MTSMSNGNRLLVLVLLGLAVVVPTIAGAEMSASEQRGGRYCPAGSDDQFDTRRLDGKLFSNARKIARRHDCDVRVLFRDGVGIPMTDDRSFDRVNIDVRDGRVVKVYGVF
jgi:hypothetical protein